MNFNDVIANKNLNYIQILQFLLNVNFTLTCISYNYSIKYNSFKKCFIFAVLFEVYYMFNQFYIK
jgi:hypothetical protein